MRERDWRLDTDQDYSERARDLLWQVMDGEEKVSEFLGAVEEAGGTLNIHGSAARALFNRDEIKEGQKKPFGDIDFVVTGVEGKALEGIVKRVFAEGWDVSARKYNEENTPTKTIELAKGGKLLAEVICARKNDIPNPHATMDDHLEGCFTPDGRLVAFQLTSDETGRMKLRKIEKEKETVLDAGTVRPDHLWLWFHALATGKVPKDKEREVQEMIKQFIKERGEELVMWRYPDEPLDEWMERRKKVQGVSPSRVKEVELRSFGRCNVEGIVKKLNTTLATDPEKLYQIGIQTGLLPRVFPVLQIISDNPEVGLRIRQGLEDCKRRGVKDVGVLWQFMFKPVLREMYRPFREKGYIPPRGRGLIPLNATYLFTGDVGEVDSGKKGNSSFSQEKDMTSWRSVMLQVFSRYHEDRMLGLLRKQKVEFFQYENLDGVVKTKVARELALIALEDPGKIFSLLVSYLPIRGMVSREIWDLALVTNY